MVTAATIYKFSLRREDFLRFFQQPAPWRAIHDSHFKMMRLQVSGVTVQCRQFPIFKLICRRQGLTVAGDFANVQPL